MLQLFKPLDHRQGVRGCRVRPGRSGIVNVVSELGPTAIERRFGGATMGFWKAWLCASAPSWSSGTGHRGWPSSRGLQDGADSGLNRFGGGAVSRVIGGHWSWSAMQGLHGRKDHTYSFPGGVISTCCGRSVPASCCSQVGLGAFSDWRWARRHRHGDGGAGRAGTRRGTPLTGPSRWDWCGDRSRPRGRSARESLRTWMPILPVLHLDAVPVLVEARASIPAVALGGLPGPGGCGVRPQDVPARLRPAHSARRPPTMPPAPQPGTADGRSPLIAERAARRSTGPAASISATAFPAASPLLKVSGRANYWGTIEQGIHNGDMLDGPCSARRATRTPSSRRSTSSISIPAAASTPRFWGWASWTRGTSMSR